MPGFLYFLEDCSLGQVRDLLPMRELGYLPADKLRMRGVSHGPGGRDGIVVGNSDQLEAGQVGYWQGKQIWRRVPRQAAWTGYFIDSRPGPEDLVRGEIVPGEDVRLGDGNLWHVPHAIDFHGPGLSRVMELDDDGRWVAGEVVPEHRALWDLAWQWRDALDELCRWGDAHKDSGGNPQFDGFSDERMTADWIFSRSVHVLQTNYVVGQAEAAMLGLFVTGGQWTVLQALCDAQGLRQIMEGAVAEEQKKTAGSPDTTPGSGDELPDTDRRLPIC